MRSLRARLIFSHLLPLLVIVPLAGAALVYLIETRVLLDIFSGNLTRQAVLVAEITGENTFVWFDEEAAGGFIGQISPHLSARIALIDPSGRILASDAPGQQAGASIDGQSTEWKNAIRGGISTRSFYDSSLGRQSAQVMVPVIDSEGRVIGVVELTSSLSEGEEQILRLRILVFGVLAVGLLAGVVLGWRLAAQLAAPLRRTTEAVQALAEGKSPNPLPEQGPEEIRTLARAFNYFRSRTRSLEESRQRLLANLAHELSRPLGALLSGIQALEGGAHRNPKLRRDLLQGMEGEIRIMRKLIDEIAHLYGRTLGPLELNRVETSPNEWLPRVLAPWREAARSKRLRFETDIPEGLPGIRIDPDRMEQALGNLLSNAVKFTPHGRIAFRVRTAGDSICLEVADTGPGIPAEELPRIFLPFHRGSTGGRFPRGMGLGLSIARDIAEAHGGTLEARNESGRGAVFSLILPLHAPATTSDAAS